jgi:ABC-type transporter Mla subunit MlaD
MELLNQVRAYHYLANVLTNQQHDLFCHTCSAWNNTLNNTREALKQLEAGHAIELGNLSPVATALLSETRSRLAGLVNAADPAGQKKAGNCKLPEGVCFVKASRAILEKV